MISKPTSNVIWGWWGLVHELWTLCFAKPKWVLSVGWSYWDTQWVQIIFEILSQVNLCQKLLFLHQLTRNMTSDRSLNSKFNTYMKIPRSNLRRICVQKGYPTEIVTDIQNNFFTQHVLTVFCKMRRASNKYLPVKTVLVKSIDTVNERRISKCWQKVCLLFLTFFKRLLEFFLSALFALEFGIE